MVEVGSRIGAYIVIDRIGAGSTSEVWLAKHARLGRRAAVKVLRPELSSQVESVARFFNEARATTTIVDPGIVQILDFGEHVDGRAYVVTELLAGEPLAARLRRQPTLPVVEALRLVQQLAISLGVAHARGVVHRDLKPENIFIVPDPEAGDRAKLVDFGIAKLTHRARPSRRRSVPCSRCRRSARSARVARSIRRRCPRSRAR